MLGIISDVVWFMFTDASSFSISVLPLLVSYCTNGTGDCNIIFICSWDWDLCSLCALLVFTIRNNRRLPLLSNQYCNQWRTSVRCSFHFHYIYEIPFMMLHLQFHFINGAPFIRVYIFSARKFALLILNNSILLFIGFIHWLHAST